MPGENCCIVYCSASRRDSERSFFKLPSKRLYPEWRQQWIDIITRTRVLDEDFEGQIERDTVHVCDRHFPLVKLKHVSRTYFFIFLFFIFLQDCLSYI